jgi:Fur family ferric uptake transcriptional regulator
MRADAVNAIGVLRAEGRRITTARRTIIELLGETPDHLTAEDIAAHVHAAHPEIHMSTVYRTLESLEAWGLVEHFHHGHSAAFFHLSAAHPHAVCTDCGRVFDVPAREFVPLIEHVRDAYGFELDIAHNALIGRCLEHAPSACRDPVPVRP